MILVTGDTHGSYKRLRKHFNRPGREAGPADVLILLGDTGLNYYGDQRDEPHLKSAARLNLTLLCLRGNHDRAPESVAGYRPRTCFEGRVFVDQAYPRLLFAPAGEIYQIEGRVVLTVGGAYSVDKEWRLANGYNWFPDEQMSPDQRAALEKRLDILNWRVDLVMTHTCPMRFRPQEALFPGLDQRSVDTSTEIWLDRLEERLTYSRWFCGHYHIDKESGPVRFVYHDVVGLE